MLKRLLLLLSLIFWSSAAFAATTPNSIIMPQTPTSGTLTQFLQGTDSAGTYKTVYTASGQGTVVKGLWANSNDTAVAHLVTCQIVNTAVKYGGIAVNVPINAGFAAGVPPVNLLAPGVWVGLPVDSDNNPIFFMKSGDTLQCTFATALTTSTLINVWGAFADY